ncbi:hypothetical protein F1643_13300, partial [Azospirillum sp. INR13]|uniref:hypothetical protein n=1 Tax=Azospirillum sp. INR13 TaxID=2596919 RepID=UPI0019D541C3
MIQGGSGKWVRAQSGLLTYVPAGVPPIEYDAAGAVLGLRCERSAPNLVTANNAFGTGQWTRVGATVVENAAIGPDGA